MNEILDIRIKRKRISVSKVSGRVGGKTQTYTKDVEVLQAFRKYINGGIWEDVPIVEVDKNGNGD